MQIPTIEAQLALCNVSISLSVHLIKVMKLKQTRILEWVVPGRPLSNLFFGSWWIKSVKISLDMELPGNMRMLEWRPDYFPKCRG